MILVGKKLTQNCFVRHYNTQKQIILQILRKDVPKFEAELARVNWDEVSNQNQTKEFCNTCTFNVSNTVDISQKTEKGKNTATMVIG